MALDLEQIESSEDGKLNPITEAADPTALEPHTDFTSYDICINGTPDSSPATSSEPCESADAELNRLSIFKFSAANVFQHSPMGDVLNSLKNLSLAGDSPPNYVRFELAADDGEFCFPPATHFIATVENPTNMLGPGSEDIDGVDNDEGQGQNSVPARRGMATSWYDVCMVDTPNDVLDDDKVDPVKDKPHGT